jgi:hypothetical protein
LHHPKRIAHDLFACRHPADSIIVMDVIRHQAAMGQLPCSTEPFTFCLFETLEAACVLSLQANVK